MPHLHTLPAQANSFGRFHHILLDFYHASYQRPSCPVDNDTLQRDRQPFCQVLFGAERCFYCLRSLLPCSLTEPTCSTVHLRCHNPGCTGRSSSARAAPVAQRTQRNKLVVKAADDRATGQEAGLKDTKDLKEDIIFKPFDEVTSFPGCSHRCVSCASTFWYQYPVLLVMA